jgi:PAS domain S-box-containing protein
MIGVSVIRWSTASLPAIGSMIGVFIFAIQAILIGKLLLEWRKRKAMEDRVREMEQRFALVADTVPVMIWMSGKDKLCSYCNRGWLSFTGTTIDQELGNGWLDSVHAGDAERCFHAYSAAFEAREKFELEHRLRRFDGEYRWVIDHGVPRHEPDGTFAGYIGSCIDITDLKCSAQELKQLSSRLIHAQEDERSRIARELHDDFGQQLTLLGLELARVSVDSNHEPRIEGLVRNLEVRIKDLAAAMNNCAHQLHSSQLETLGLVSAIKGLCCDFSRQYAISVDFKENGIPPGMPSSVSLCLFRIVQEGLQNVAKHSKAPDCRVELTSENGDVLLNITDSGVGFDPASLKSKAGLGLISMRERLRLVNGQVRLLSSPRQGTRLEVRVPLNSMAACA